MKHLLLWIGLSAGNFLFQLVASQQWRVAIGCSFFQGIAIFCCWFLFAREIKKISVVKVFLSRYSPDIQN